MRCRAAAQEKLGSEGDSAGAVSGLEGAAIYPQLLHASRQAILAHMPGFNSVIHKKLTQETPPTALRTIGRRRERGEQQRAHSDAHPAAAEARCKQRRVDASQDGDGADRHQQARDCVAEAEKHVACGRVYVCVWGGGIVCIYATISVVAGWTGLHERCCKTAVNSPPHL